MDGGRLPLIPASSRRRGFVLRTVLTVCLAASCPRGAGAGWDALLAMVSLGALVPVLLTAGNFLSLAFPVKFHANLQRRDRLPLIASMLGVAAASLGCAPFALSLRTAHQRPGPTQVLLVLACAALSWGLYALLVPTAVRALEARREAVFQGVTRD